MRWYSGDGRKRLASKNLGQVPAVLFASKVIGEHLLSIGRPRSGSSDRFLAQATAEGRFNPAIAEGRIGHAP